MNINASSPGAVEKIDHETSRVHLHAPHERSKVCQENDLYRILIEPVLFMSSTWGSVVSVAVKSGQTKKKNTNRPTSGGCPLRIDLNVCLVLGGGSKRMSVYLASREKRGRKFSPVPIAARSRKERGNIISW